MHIFPRNPNYKIVAAGGDDKCMILKKDGAVDKRKCTEAARYVCHTGGKLLIVFSHGYPHSTFIPTTIFRGNHHHYDYYNDDDHHYNYNHHDLHHHYHDDHYYNDGRSVLHVLHGAEDGALRIRGRLGVAWNYYLSFIV